MKKRLINRYRFPDRLLILLLVLSLSSNGCIHYRPNPGDRDSFMARAQTQESDKLRVTTTVLSDKESKHVFGKALAKKGIQPVWVEIENRGKTPSFFIPRNMDPNYFSPKEAAYMSHYRQSRQFLEAGLLSVIFFPALALIPVNFFAVRHANSKIDALFGKLSFRNNIIMPQSKESGFVFTSVDEGSKHLKVDLADESGHNIFDFAFQVPGLRPDYTTKDFENRYPEEKIAPYNDQELANVLEGLPCCVTDKKGKKNGDPINLAVIGELEDIVSLFTSAEWDETQALGLQSGLSMAKAFFTGENDRYSPVSPLYFHGRPQDAAFQKTRNNINQRLHFRLWYTPMRYRSKPVWIGAISRDIGVKFTWKTWYLTTHKIDPDVDDSRDYLLADMMQLGKIAQYGFIDNRAAQNASGPRKNLTNDPYSTDNKILVLELSKEDTKLSAFPWSQPISKTVSN